MRLTVTGAVAIVAIAGLGACSSTTSSQPQESVSASASKTWNPLPGYTPAQSFAFGTAFAKTLTGKGLTPEQVKAVGGCVWRGITTTIPYADFAAYGQNAKSPTGIAVTQKLSDIATACESNNSAY